MPAPYAMQTPVNTVIDGAQNSSHTVALISGGYVVVWAQTVNSATMGLYARMFGADGQPTGDQFSIDSHTDGVNPFHLTALADGGFAVVWEMVDAPSETSIYVRQFDSSGTAAGDRILAYASGLPYSTAPDIAGLEEGGGFVIVWTTHQSDGSDSDVYSQVYDATGAKVGSEVRVGTTTLGDQMLPRVASLDGGGYVVVWMNVASDYSSAAFAAQRYDADGLAVGPEIQVGSSLSRFSSNDVVTGLKDGGFVVVWQAEDNGAASIHLQRYAADGSPVGGDVTVASLYYSSQAQITVAALDDGGYLVDWTGYTTRYGPAGAVQRYGADGLPVGDAIALSHGQGDSEGLSVLNNGAVVHTWTGTGLGSPSPDADVYQAYYSDLSAVGETPAILGTEGADKIDGRDAAHTMVGLAGDDTYIIGFDGGTIIEQPGGGIDEVWSSAETYVMDANVENLGLVSGSNGTGNDLGNTIRGNDYANRLDGGGGEDILIGGRGDDTYIVDNAGDQVFEIFGRYLDNSNHITLEGLDTVMASVSYALGGQYVEILVLTGTANINATGNGLNNVLTGNSGNNILNGSVGADSMNGGAGDDIYFVDQAGDLVTELAGEGNDTVWSSISYTLGANVEYLGLLGAAAIDGIGNALDNIIQGNSGNNVLRGGAGNDIIASGAGADSFVFEAPAANGLDWLADFVSGADHLVFTAADYGFTAGHTLTSAELSPTGLQSGTTGQFIYNPINHALYWDSDGTGSAAPVVLAVFGNNAQPALSDFVFV